MSRETLGLGETVRDYLLDKAVREPDILRRLREETATLSGAQMQIAPEQGAFMTVLTEMLAPRRAVEIGVFTGYSSLCVAMAMPEDGVLHALDRNEETAAVAQRYWQEAGVADRINLRLGDGVSSLDTLIEEEGEGTFDLAFIDADKGNYGTYFDGCLRLLRPGGLIMVDNVLWSGRVADPDDQENLTNAIRSFNDKVAGDERVSLCMVPIGDGVTMARKR